MKKRLLILMVALAAMIIITFAPQKVDAAETDRYGYGLLKTEKERELYELLVDALDQCEDEISVYDYRFSMSDLINAEQMVRRDYPEFFYYAQCGYSITYDNIIWSVDFRYALDGEIISGDSAELKAARIKFDNKVAQIVKNATGSDYQKALYLHDYIVNNTVYVRTDNDQSAYGALIDGKAVCAGYSHAYQLLLREVGIESFYVTGTSKGVPHAWLLVFLNGECYYTDVTWDDPVTTDGSNVLGHYYFDMSYDEISKDHIFDSEYYDWLPEKHDHHDLYYYVKEAKEGSGIGWFNSNSAPEDLYKYLKQDGYTYTCDFRYDGNDVGTWLSKAVQDAAYKVGATGAYYTQIGHEFKLTLTVPEPTLIASGKCGSNLTWKVDSTNTLTISGSGAMNNYDSGSNPAPWQAYADSIKNIVIDDKVTSIGTYAFKDCVRLTTFTVPSNIKKLPNGVFVGCYRLNNVNIHDGVTAIGDNAFYGCTALEEIELPDSLMSVGESAFQGCTDLISITIPKGVTTISDSSFHDCMSLRSITISGDVKSIGSYAFRNCYNLTRIDLPETVTNIGDYAFYACNALTTIDIPSNVTTIGTYAFAECSLLTSITIPDGVTTIADSMFLQCTGLKGIVIPDSVTSIQKWAFNGCANLWHVMYAGTEAQWNNIQIASYNNLLSATTRHYNCADNTKIDITTKYCCICNGCKDVNMDNVCDVCGTMQGPVYVSNVKFASTGLSLGTFIGLQNLINPSSMNGGVYDEAYFIYEQYTFTEDGLALVDTVRADFTPYSIYLVADVSVNAKQMADLYEITPYYVVDGVTYYGATTTTSVKAEAMKKVNDTKTDAKTEKTRALCVAMLNYGAEAQKNFKYSLQNLANSELSAGQKVIPGFDDLSMIKENTIPATPFKPASSGLSLGDVVYMQFLVAVKHVDTNGTLQYQIPGEQVFTIDCADLEKYGTSYYLINLPIKAKYVRSDITIRFVGADNVTDYTMVCSIEAFASTYKGKNTETLVAALMAYGDAADVLF